jgi:hypothetical protein
MSALAMLDIVIRIQQILAKLMPAHAVPELLFGGQITSEQKTKFAFKETVSRYKKSIQDVNRSLTLTVGLTIIALYAYLVLPATGEVKIPIVALTVSRQLWIRCVPAVAYILQAFSFTAFIWFILLRLALKMLLAETPKTKGDYGDVTNIALAGTLGQLWIILRIKQFYASKWNYIWYLPTLLLVVTIFLAPMFVCLFFIYQLFIPTSVVDLVLCVVYGTLFIPYALFFILLTGTAAVLGVLEGTIKSKAAATNA